MRLIELRSAEADFARAGTPPVALLPIGAVEQHSTHLPLGTDALLVTHVATRAESEDPDRLLLLPTIYVGASDHHLAKPGTLSVGTITIADAVTKQFLSLARSGITRFFILNGHGGNQPATRLALEQLHAANPDVLGYGVDYWALMFEQLDAQQISRPDGMGHADLFETSMLLSAYPDLVRMDLAVEGGYLDELPAAVATTLGIPERTANGGVGDPTGATADLGETYIAAAVAGVRQLLDQIQKG